LCRPHPTTVLACEGDPTVLFTIAHVNPHPPIFLRWTNRLATY
jgi:hypothetical protein